MTFSKSYCLSLSRIIFRR